MIQDNLKEQNSEMDSTAEESQAKPHYQSLMLIKDRLRFGLRMGWDYLTSKKSMIWYCHDLHGCGFLVDDLDLELVDEEDDEEPSSN